MEQIIKKTGSVLEKILQNCRDTWQENWNKRPESEKREIEKRDFAETMPSEEDLNTKYKIPERYHNSTFENFNANTQELEKAVEILKNKAWESNIYLSGKAGTGKTHLAMCLKREEATYFKLSEIFRKVRLDFNCEQSFINHLGSVKLLIIDEIGRQNYSVFEKNLFFEIIDERWLNKKPTLLISNLTGNEFAEEYGKAILDRLRPIKIELTGESKRA